MMDSALAAALLIPILLLKNEGNRRKAYMYMMVYKILCTMLKFIDIQIVRTTQLGILTLQSLLCLLSGFQLRLQLHEFSFEFVFLV